MKLAEDLTASRYMKTSRWQSWVTSTRRDPWSPGYGRVKLDRVLTEGGAARELVSWYVQRVLLIVWCCFIVYGSFMPFRISTNPDFVRSRLAQVQFFPFQGGTKNFSLPDVGSNVLLFIPFGFLLSGSGFWTAGRSWALRLGVSGGLALVFAGAIEVGQLFSPGRATSGIDVEADVFGALLGAIGARLLHRFRERADFGVQLAHDEPRLVPIALMTLWLCSEAFYPFEITLDVSTVWHNLTHGRWIPFQGPRQFWLDRVVDEAVMFAMLTALVVSALRRRVSGPMAAWTAALTAIMFSCILEAEKLFFVARLPNVENVLLASTGAVLGVTVVPMAMQWWPIKRHPEWALAALALALLAYSELTPFGFLLSPTAIAKQSRRIEWIPLFSYYSADPQSALFDLWKKLLLSGFWGFAFGCARDATPLGAARAGLVIGGLLEATQLLTVSRIPSVTDVLSFGLGAWIGGAIYQHYRPATPVRCASST